MEVIMIKAWKTVFLTTIFAVSLSFIAVPVYSAIYGTVTGRVVDSDGDPISGVTVKIVSDEGRNPDREAISNRRGVYRIANVNTGNYEITAEKNGYMHRNKVGFRVSANSRISLDVYMDRILADDDQKECSEQNRE
jgi:hypothetical protein